MSFHRAGLCRRDVVGIDGLRMPRTAILLHWICRFDDDNVDFSKMWFQFWELKKLSFTTVKGTSA